MYKEEYFHNLGRETVVMRLYYLLASFRTDYYGDQLEDTTHFPKYCIMLFSVNICNLTLNSSFKNQMETLQKNQIPQTLYNRVVSNNVQLNCFHV